MKSFRVSRDHTARQIVFMSSRPTLDKPVFGQYACAGPSGAVLRVGDQVQVTERIKKEPTPLLPQSPALEVR